jgi:hypothetical protein
MPDRQDDLNPASDLAPFADALRRLAPQPPELSRDALLFEAGKAAAVPRAFPWLWQTTTGVFAAVSFVLGAFLISPDAPRVVPDAPAPQVVYKYVPEPDRPQPPAAEPEAAPKKAKASEEFTETARLLKRRRDVLRWGVDMLPESKPSAAGPSADVAARETTHWLNLPPGTFALPAAQPRKPAPKDEDSDE